LPGGGHHRPFRKRVLKVRTRRGTLLLWFLIRGYHPGRESAAHLLELERAAICCANSVVWMPWNRPSSQPTS